MSRKNDIDPTGRDVFFTPAGNNDFSGLSVETAVADPSQAITLANAINPPAGASDPASINASVSGTYSDGVIVPEFVTCNSSSASILTSDAVTVQVMGRHTIEWGSLLNFSNNGICVQIDGVTRTAVEVNAVAPIGDDGIGFNVTGVCDEVFIQLRLGDIQGERGIMFEHTANSPTPIQYNVENIAFNAADQTAIRYNDPVVTTATVFNISDVQTRNGGSVAPGSTVAHIINGTAVLDCDVLNAETIARVEGGGTLTLSAQTLFGNTLIESGGIALYPSIALCVGDLETQGTGTLQTKILTIIGNITNEGGMSIEANSVQGDIVNNGTMFAIIDSHVGTLTNNGTINGIINGVRFGNWRHRDVMETLLAASSFDDQNPSGLDAPLQISFGPAKNGPTDPVEIDDLGNITINEADQYLFTFTVQYGRSGAGGDSWLFFRLLIDGVQLGDSILAQLDNSESDLPIRLTRNLNLTSGQVVTTEVVRDSQGNDSGGLKTESPTLSWSGSPSAAMVIERSVLH